MFEDSKKQGASGGCALGKSSCVSAASTLFWWHGDNALPPHCVRTVAVYAVVAGLAPLLPLF